MRGDQPAKKSHREREKCSGNYQPLDPNLYLEPRFRASEAGCIIIPLGHVANSSNYLLDGTKVTILIQCPKQLVKLDSNSTVRRFTRLTAVRGPHHGRRLMITVREAVRGGRDGDFFHRLHRAPDPHLRTRLVSVHHPR